MLKFDIEAAFDVIHRRPRRMLAQCFPLTCKRKRCRKRRQKIIRAIRLRIIEKTERAAARLHQDEETCLHHENAATRCSQ